LRCRPRWGIRPLAVAYLSDELIEKLVIPVEEAVPGTAEEPAHSEV